MLHERIKRLGFFLAFGIAYLSLGFIGWAANYVRNIPYDGFEWKIITGRVQEVDPDGPAAGLIQPGDQILAVDNVPPEASLPLYSNYTSGDSIQFRVLSETGEQRVNIRLSHVPKQTLLRWLIPYVISVFFWLVASAILAFGRSGRKEVLFFLWGMLVSNLLASGSISSVGPNWTSTLFNSLLWFVGPLTAHFHLHLLELESGRWRWPLGFMYGIALIGSLPFIIWGSNAVQRSGWLAVVYTAERIVTAIGLTMSVALLFVAYRTARRSVVRQKIRIVSLNGSIALVPLVVFNILPDALFRSQYLPYEISFAFLIAIPAGYGYAIARHQLIRLDRFMNRAATYTLIVVIMAGLYSVILGVVRTVLRPEEAYSPVVQVVTALVLGASLPPIHKRVQSLVDWAFYGGWYDYRSAVEQITKTLQSITDPSVLAKTLSKRIRTTLRLESTATLVLVPFGVVLGSDRLDSQSPNQGIVLEQPSMLLPRNGLLRKFLHGRSKPLEARQARRILSSALLTSGECELLEMIDGEIWAPIHGPTDLLGLIILGPRLANETFHSLDMDIIQQVAQHVGAVIDNIGLLHQLQARAEEVEHLNRQIVTAREAERKALSHELHDEVIQDLVALTYEIGREPDVESAELRTKIREVIRTVRGIIRQLRPPVLDNLGLVSALRGCVREFRERCGDETTFTFWTNCEAEQWFPEEIAIAVYRVAFESLSNSEKYAEAGSVDVRLNCEDSRMVLEIQDDGIGFKMPNKLGELVMDRHYGIVTMRERMELINGTLEVETEIGRGTIIRAEVPMHERPLNPVEEREVLHI